MEYEIERHLRAEIDAQLGYLGEVEPGTDEYKARVDGITKLMDRAIEMEKLAREDEYRVKSHKDEVDLKLKELEENRKGRWVRDGLSVAFDIGEKLFIVWGLYKTFKFEETGTVTTHVGKGFFSRFLPRRK